ncbi:MAG: NAD(P)H-hydrate dehydratase [Lachnospiraceae bacterium]|nr:NAD(P)H-hydrate dehydratase [Lachnospiraceae bacterium]
MEQILSVSQMRKSDAAAIQSGTSGITLMKRAGDAIFQAADWKDPVAIVCGSGNNAGDGYVLAGLLADAGHQVTVFMISDRCSADGKYYLDQLLVRKVELVKIICPDLTGYAMIVDCIFGTGFHGTPEGAERDAILEINRCHDLGAFVLSVDINSGLNGDNGLGETVVRSDLTVSVGFFQPGHFLNSASDVMKQRVNCPIGIEPLGEEWYVPSPADYAAAFPERAHDTNKGRFGYVALIGGSVRYSGAAKLANLSAVPVCDAAGRAGAGVVKLAVPGSIGFAVMPYLLESTLFPLSEDEEHQFVFREDEIRELTANTRTVTVGMGFTGGDEVEKLIRFLLKHLPKEKTLIVDAEGLNTIAGFPDLREVLSEASPKVVLTPHLMEFSRLTGLTIPEIRKDPVGLVKHFSGIWNCTVLLKGPVTLVSDGAKVYFVDAGVPGMATAGSGDVLSGVLGAMLAGEGETAFLTAAGAYLAGKAGEIAQKKLGDISMMAGDTVAELSEAIRLIRASV